jgi:hypothetical protein
MIRKFGECFLQFSSESLPYRLRCDYQKIQTITYSNLCMNVRLLENYRSSVFGDRVARNAVGFKTEQVRGLYRKVHNVELQNVHSSPNIISAIILQHVC